MNIPVIKRVLEKNDSAAAENRALFDQLGIRCVNILGGAGCGKTALLEAVLPLITPQIPTAVMEGDLTTTRDAERIAALGVPVAQLLTDGGCHLTAPHVRRALDTLPLERDSLLIIENVGNPVCPANFDLGEHARIAVLSISEGDDKPSKYPLLFRNADLVVFTKCDLTPLVNFDVRGAADDVRRVNPGVVIVCTSRNEVDGAKRIAAWLTEPLLRSDRPRRAEYIHH